MARILDLGHRNVSLAFLFSLYLWPSSVHFCYISFLLDFVPNKKGKIPLLITRSFRPLKLMNTEKEKNHFFPL